MQLAINPFRNRAKTEKETEIKVEKDVVLEEVIEKYLTLERQQGKYYYQTEDTLKQIQTPVLTPVQIDNFLQYVIETDKFYASQNQKSDITGKFITKLIQQSYDNGNNEFILNTKDTQIDQLGCYLNGTEQNKIKITIQGNAGFNCGIESEHSQFDIQGNTGCDCGWNSEYSQFNIQGNIGDGCGYFSTNSIFQTTNPATYIEMLKDVPRESEVHFIKQV